MDLFTLGDPGGGLGPQIPELLPYRYIILYNILKQMGLFRVFISEME